jgi:hypothetical protein
MRASSAYKKRSSGSRKSVRKTALKRFPGAVTVQELEREKGKLIYSFEIRDAKGIITDVHVSAITGQILGVLNESEAREAAEKRKEANESLRSPRSPLEYKRQLNGEDAPDEAKKAAFTVRRGQPHPAQPNFKGQACCKLLTDTIPAFLQKAHRRSRTCRWRFVSR